MKNKLNNQKNRQIRGKIIKSSMTFNKNKPNSKNIKIGVSPFKTGKCEILPAWRGKNQTQFKANSNPIAEKAIINISSFMTSKYEDKSCERAKKQTQTNLSSNVAVGGPIFTQCLCLRYAVEKLLILWSAPATIIRKSVIRQFIRARLYRLLFVTVTKIILEHSPAGSGINLEISCHANEILF